MDYLVNRLKSWSIVKQDVPEDDAKKVFGEEVSITTEGQRHLGDGSQEYNDKYCRKKVLGWKGEIEACTVRDIKKPASCGLQRFSPRATNPNLPVSCVQ